MLSLTRWNPFEEMTNLHRGLDQTFGMTDEPVRRNWSWLPAAEVTSGSDGWTIRMALPGIDPKDVNVDLDHHVLTISGERSVPEEKTKKHMSELGYGRFTRRMSLILIGGPVLSIARLGPCTMFSAAADVESHLPSFER